LLFLIVALGKFKLFWFLALDLCGWKKQMCLNVRWRSGVAYNGWQLPEGGDFTHQLSFGELPFKYTQNCPTKHWTATFG